MRSIVAALVVLLAFAEAPSLCARSAEAQSEGTQSEGTRPTETSATRPVVSFRAVTRTAIAGSEQTAMSTSVRGWADGERGRVEFEGGNRALVGEGTVLFTEDGAATAMLFDAPRRVCSPWPGGAAAAPGRMRSAVPIEDLSVALVVDEPGPEILGLPTRHYRFEISWRAPAQAATSPAEEGSADAGPRSETIEDLWVTSRLEDPGLRLWLRPQAHPTGDPDADRRIQVALDEVGGIVLERETLLRVERAGQRLETTVTLEVTHLERGPAPKGTFEAPEACRASGQEPVS